MTNKKARINRGREIRRATGIKLPIAMQLAKRERRGIPTEEEFPGVVVRTTELLEFNRDAWVKIRVEYCGPRGKVLIKEEMV